MNKLESKLTAMPENARKKLKKTIEKLLTMAQEV